MKKFYAILLAIFLLPLLSRGQSAIDLTATGNKITGTYNLNLSTGFTVEYWFKMNAAPTAGQTFGTFSKSSANLPQPIDVYINGAGQFCYLLGNNATFLSYTTTFSPVVGTWYHIAHTYDVANNLSIVYVNGVNIQTDVPRVSDGWSSSPLVLSNSANPFYMGNRHDNATEANITIDELRIWSVVRTATQISTNKNACLTGSETGLDVYYKMNEGTGTVLTDLATANGSQNGTITGTVAWGVSPIDPVAPTVTTPITYTQGANATALTATGTSLNWYTVATGGSGSSIAPIPFTATLGTTSYWVTQTNAGGCESPRAKIDVTVISPPATHLHFDGTNDFVSFNNSISTTLDPLNTITVEAWVRPETNTGNGPIVGNYAYPTANNQMQFLLRRDGATYTFWVNDGTGFKAVVTPANAVVLNTWQHVVGVWNGSDIKIYVDGVLKATTTGVSIRSTNPILPRINSQCSFVS
jgi:hypothetical protein